MKRELTFTDSIKLMGILAAALAFMVFVSGCDMATAPAIAAADSSRKADTTKAPSSELLGAWRSDDSGLDSMQAIAFLATGRAIRSNPSCGSSGDGVMNCEPYFESGRWSANNGSVSVDVDSVGVLRTSRLVGEDDRCDSLICWAPSNQGSTSYPYVVHGRYLTIGRITYARITP